MPCLITIIALGAPRIALLLVWLFSDYLGRAIHSGLMLLLGFIFMPLTTLAYAFAINSHGSVDGGYLVLVILGVLMDLGVFSGAGVAHQRRLKA